MKNGHFFWGTFFLAFGLIWLAGKMHFTTEWDFVFSLYPLILVFWGLLIITKNTIVKPFISAGFGAFIAILVYGTASNIFGFFEDEFSFTYTDSNPKQIYYQAYENDVAYGYFSLNTGATSFKIKNNTDSLISASAYGKYSDYTLTTSTVDSLVKVDFSNDNDYHNIKLGKNRSNSLSVNLNSNPIWDMNLNYGAAKANIDLSEFKIRNLNIHTGASSSTIILGDKFERTEVNIEMGVSSFKIKVPKSSGIKIYSDLGLSSKNFGQFNKIDKNTYVSSNFEESNNKVFIDISGALSNFKVERY
jgi:hypothetical protein